MKAIRGDNPRTTNQRVYLMPVVPPPPPEKPPPPPRRPTWNSFPSLSLSPSIPLRRYLSSVYLLVSLSFSPSAFPSHSLCLSRLVSLVDPPLLPPLRSRSRVITLLLSDMSLCYRHNQPALPSLFAPLLTHTLGRPLRRTFPPRYLQRVVRSRIPAI